jgi:hypothetical protein
MFSGGHAPQTPLGRLRRSLGSNTLLRSRTTFFASFSGKRRILCDRFRMIQVSWMFWAGFAGIEYSPAKQDNAFCFFFWKKKNTMR